MVHNKITPPALSAVKIQGSISDLFETFALKRITSEYAQTVVYQEAEDAFKNQVDDETIIGYWQGEFWGKWMISAARVCRYQSNAELREFIRQGAYHLIGYQRPDGYLGTYKDSLNFYACDRDEAKKVVGWACNWNWNIWCRKYTLWGLIECYQLLTDPKILDAAELLATHLINELQDNQVRLCDTGTFNGLPSGSIIKPMTLLWEITGKPEYLDFAVTAAGYWELPDGRCPNLITNARSGKPLHQWYPESQNWAKAYELMSCLDGLLELYRATGEQKYFTAVTRIYDLLEKYEANAVFSVGFNDIFANASKLINTASEPCDVIHWMRLSYELFTITGSSRYMDNFELAFYNAFLAGVYRDGQWGSRGVRSTGQHITSLLQAGFTKNHCCVNNLPRGFMNMAQAIAMRGSEGIYINLFSEAEVSLAADDGQPVQIKIGGSFLQDCRAVIEIGNGSTQPTRLLIRIPSWSKKTAVSCNSNSWSPAAGSYFKIAVPGGKSIIDIAFDNTPVQRDFPDEVALFGPEEFQRSRWTLDPSQPQSYVPYDYMVKERMSTLCVGPLLLARSKRIGNTEAEMFHSRTICGRGYQCRVTPEPMADVRCGFVVEFVSASDSFKSVMCDYASAGNEIVKDGAYFNIYL